MKTRSTTRRRNRLLFALCPLFNGKRPREVSLKKKLRSVVTLVTPEELEVHLLHILSDNLDLTFFQLEDMFDQIINESGN